MNASHRIINDAYEYIEYGMVANEFHTDVKEKSISVSRGVNVSGGQTGAVSAEAIQTRRSIVETTVNSGA